MSGTPRRSVAVVGAGVSGLTAAWILQRDAEVTLYEALPRLGGHAHTHDVAVGDRYVRRRQRVHRPQRADLPQPAAAVRRARCRNPRDADEHVGALRRLRPRVRRLQRIRRRLRPRRTHSATLPTCACWPRSSDSTSRPDDSSASRRKPLARSTPSCARAATRATSSSTSWCRSSRACGRARRAPHSCIRPATCSSSSITTACFRCTGSPTWRTVVGGSRTYVERAAKELTAVRTQTPVRAVIRKGERHRDPGRRRAGARA